MFDLRTLPIIDYHQLTPSRDEVQALWLVNGATPIQRSAKSWELHQAGSLPQRVWPIRRSSRHVEIVGSWRHQLHIQAIQEPWLFESPQEAAEAYLHVQLTKKINALRGDCHNIGIDFTMTYEAKLIDLGSK